MPGNFFAASHAIFHIPSILSTAFAATADVFIAAMTAIHKITTPNIGVISPERTLKRAACKFSALTELPFALTHAPFVSVSLILIVVPKN